MAELGGAAGEDVDKGGRWMQTSARFPREKPITKHGVNAKVYADKVLKGPLKAAVDEMSDSLGGTVFVVEDGAPLHTGKAAVNARRELGFIQFDHPTRSPDLNPIETIWHLLKRRVGMMDRVATSLSELWDQLVEAWDSISTKEAATGSLPQTQTQSPTHDNEDEPAACHTSQEVSQTTWFLNLQAKS